MEILLVGNVSDEWRQLRSKLEASGHSITVATNCAVARKLLERDYELDMVILDAQSADGCGVDYVKWVRSHPRLQTTPLIMAGTTSR